MPPINLETENIVRLHQTEVSKEQHPCLLVLRPRA